MPSPLRTTSQAAEYLGVPVSTLYYWRYAGSTGPQGFKVGRHVRYKQTDLDAWIDEQIAREAA